MNYRSAEPDDAAAIRRMVADIWGGHDYLVESIDKRIAEGGVYVAELEGRLVGVTRLRRLAEDEWWLEALRVDPELWGQGLGRRLHEFTMSELRRRGVGVARWSTADTNRSVAFAARSGFRKILTMPFVYRAPGRFAGPGRSSARNQPGLDVVDIAEPGLLDFLVAGCRENYAGLLPLGWVFPEADPERLRESFARCPILVRRSESGFRAAAVLFDEDGDSGNYFLGVLCGAGKHVDGAFIDALFRLIRRKSPKGALWSHVPIQYLQPFLSRGCRRERAFNWLYVFELDLST